MAYIHIIDNINSHVSNCLSVYFQCDMCSIMLGFCKQ